MSSSVSEVPDPDYWLQARYEYEGEETEVQQTMGEGYEPSIAPGYLVHLKKFLEKSMVVKKDMVKEMKLKEVMAEFFYLLRKRLSWRVWVNTLVLLKWQQMKDWMTSMTG